MTKIEKILNEHRSCGTYSKSPIYPEADVILLMKHYAELYAKECLKIAAKQLLSEQKGGFDDCFINTNSILNIKLPLHK